MVQDTEENNVLALQEPTNNNNDDPLPGAATALSQHINQSHMKCYYSHTHCQFLDYFKDPIPDDAVIFTGDIPFQYNKIEGRYTKFIGN